ncbi:MAG: dipeptidase [Bacteroidales bacterium]|nr:dipeptidase [Bacteroidales bacterium]
MEIKEYIEKNKERFFEELFELLRIPSDSSKPEHKPDMYRCAEKIAEYLRAAGVDKAEICETAGNPVVFAEKKIDPKAPTILVYGHYDVQPAEPLELWKTNPYEPVIKDGAIWARGANDDKGQSFMHIKAFEYLIKEGKLRQNVKFMIEGEEEISSPSLAPWMKANKKKLACDSILISDTTQLSEKFPSMCTGMRGLSYLEVTVKGQAIDVHSGHYGGAIYNPVNALCDMISSLIDKEGHVTVPGFYDDVAELSRKDRKLLGQMPFDAEEYLGCIGGGALKGEKGYTTREHTAIRPCLDVNGIWGGFTAPGSKTIIPSEAHAKISMRLVPYQDSAKISKLFAKHFKKITPKGLTSEVMIHHGGESFVTPLDSKEYRAAFKAMKEVYGMEPIPYRGGGSITVIAEAQKMLKATPALMGFGLDRDAIHSPNESYLLLQFFRGIECITKFYQYY